MAFLAYLLSPDGPVLLVFLSVVVLSILYYIHTSYSFTQGPLDHRLYLGRDVG